jgi:iron complex outermembrane receptor protein
MQLVCNYIASITREACNRRRLRARVLVCCLWFAPASGFAQEAAPEAPPSAPPPAPDVITPPAPDVMTPPRVISSPPPVYPATHQGHPEHPSVLLKVTILADGSVADVQVEHSAGDDFDQAAREAVLHWTFEPARRGGQAIASRVGVAVHFELPELGEVDVTAIAQAEPVTPHEETPPPHSEAPVAGESGQAGENTSEFRARADVERPSMRPELRGASHFTISRKVLESAPRKEGAELLSSAPGVYMARSEGDAVAHGIMLRGFDADHGQDIDLRVGGIPINLPSHIHGQGYADLGFLMSETVQELRVLEGVYDPRQGDFAVAGSVDFDLGVQQRGVRASSSYGSFGTLRELLLWAPEGQSRGTFGAVQYKKSDGFGQNRASQSGSAILQGEFASGPWRYRTLAIVHAARAELAGVVRRDDVNAGRIGFYDVYPYPTAQRQNAAAARLILGATAEYRGASGDNAELGVWLSYDDFRLQENFTGFLQRSRTLLDQAGRGDLIEQLNHTKSAGLWGRYRTRDYDAARFLRAHVELGASGRMDEIDQAQNLLDAQVHGQTWDKRVDASIQGADVGMYGDADARLFERLHVRAGVRADVLLYAVNDRLGNFAPLTRPQDTYIQGFRRSAMGVAFGPRTSAELKLLEGLSLLAAYGEGYRSPQARTLDDGERAPFTKVRSADIGLRFVQGKLLSLNAAGFWTHLSNDVAFEAHEGRLENVGATRRMGTTLSALSEPLPWLTGSASLTYVDAELREPPPPSADQPEPAFKKGQNLPFVPPLVVRLDLGARRTLLSKLGKSPLTGKAGLGYSYLSPRPLPFGARAAPVSLLDASIDLRWSHFGLNLSGFNLLDLQYAATEYNFVSSWDPAAVPSRVPARHVAAGAPRSFFAMLEVTL